jgi:1,5-anhydro-D-fructose reductase (1,5-anhydro-D-mannitol-forming)
VSFGWAIAGTGAIARSRMAPAIARHGRIVAVVSASAERARAFAAETGAARACTTLDQALEDDDVEAVYVGTTNELHAEQAIACLRAGRHVLCEKPLALTLDDADAMLAAAAAAGRTLAVNHHLRASAALERLREQAGAPRLIRAFHRCHVRPERRGNWRFADPARGAGAILDLTTHTADAIRYVSSREIASVSGHAAPDGIELAVAGSMRLDDGTPVAFADWYSAAPAASAIEIHGDAGSLAARDVHDAGDEPYARTVERFTAGEPAATGADGRASLAVALALRSASAVAASVG